MIINFFILPLPKNKHHVGFARHDAFFRDSIAINQIFNSSNKKEQDKESQEEKLDYCSFKIIPCVGTQWTLPIDRIIRRYATKRIATVTKGVNKSTKLVSSAETSKPGGSVIMAS
jgi:hypothetical protein